MSRRVVITGLGAISPYGVGLDKLRDGLMNKKSGVIKLDFDPEKFRCRIGGVVTDWDPEPFIPRIEAKRQDRFLQFALGAAEMAYNDAGLNDDNHDKERSGVMVGSGIGGISVFKENTETFIKMTKVSPYFIPMIITNMASGKIAIKFGLKGPNYSVSSACATSNHALGTALDMIRFGRADLMVAGGAESAVNEIGIQGFAVMKAVSFRNDEPEKASRPFDKDRDGFVMGEGAGICILEELEHAKKRGAKIHAELIGFGMSDDAYHMVAPHPEGEAAALAMQHCLKDANIKPEEVDYVNAHGTSTPDGDIAETKAIKKAFGDHAKKLMVSSTKSLIGHLLGAAGGIELIASIIGMKDNVVFPTINLDNQDPEIDLDCIANEIRKEPTNVVLSNSFGFGGHNSTIAIRKYEE